MTSSPALLLLSFGGLSAGLVTMLVLVSSARAQRRQVRVSLAGLAGAAAPEAVGSPAREGVLLRALARFAVLGRALSQSGTIERLARQLDLAGNPSAWPVERVLAAKGAALVGFGLLGFLFFSGSAFALLIVPALAVGGFFLPDLLVYNRGLDRQEELQRGLPDALDLLTISVEAGLGFDAALAQVARNTEGPIAGEFFRALQEMQIGKSRSEAFRALGARSTVPELATFVSALVQADKLGIPLGRVLREQSKEMRLKRRQRGEEKAMKVPVKMMFPMMVFILPVLFVVTLAPGAMTILDTLGG